MGDQIGAQLDAISQHFDDIVDDNAAFYYLITTANVTDVSDIQDFASDKNITFGHYVPYYAIVDNKIQIKFKARQEGFFYGYNDLDIWRGNNSTGVQLKRSK